MSGFRQLLILGLGLTGFGFGTAALAQSGPVRNESLYLAPQALMGPNQVVGLGGAYVAIAEGATGFTSNLAALAQRAPDNDRGWDVGFALSWMTVHEEHPSTQFLVGLSLQYQRFGAGTFLRSRVESFCVDGGDRRPRPRQCADDERVTARVQHAELGAAIRVYSMDTDAHPATMVRYGVRGLPTILVFRDGEIMDRIIGATSKKTLEERFRNCARQ